MLVLRVGDRVRSMEDGVTGTVMRREHDFEHPRYVIAWRWRAKRDLAERGSRFRRTLGALADIRRRALELLTHDIHAVQQSIQQQLDERLMLSYSRGHLDRWSRQFGSI